MRVPNLYSIRKCSIQVKKPNYFVTTPIYYVNANPHIGHLYSSVIADAIQRWKHIVNKGVRVKFSTGTDEHGSKIQQSAAANNIPLLEYCNKISNKYEDLAKAFNVNYTDFIRTTDELHEGSVRQFWRTLEARGHIHSAKYSGWYCISDETFLSDSQLKETVMPDGRKIILSAESGHPAEWTEELNYIFKLNSFQEELKYWLTTNDVVRPKKFQKLLLDLVTSESMKDVSISRPSSRVHWGVRVPGDDSQTVYVWLDALVHYLTAAGYKRLPDSDFHKTWPPDVHVIGKDILKFHGIYWPAFLMAAGLEPPRSILCHSHWTVDGEKMSKSKNNVVCPFNRSEIYTSDGLRYFLLREGVAHSDGNYSDTKVIRILNAELADTLGNLLSRCCGTALNPNQVFPEIKPGTLEAVCQLDVTKELIDNVSNLPGVCKRHYEDWNFYKAVDSVVATLHSANLFFETLKPWELKKRNDTVDQLDAVLHITMETLRICAVLLEPIVPNISRKLLDKLAVPCEKRFFDSLSDMSWNNGSFKEIRLSGDSAVLFRRIVSAEKKEKIKKKS